MLKNQKSSFVRISRALSVLSAAFCASLLGISCSAEPDEGVGVVHIAIAKVPSDVNCIQITADGSRTVSKEFDVVPGDGSVLVMNAIPAGTVLFSGNAFPSSCSNRPAGAIPNWTSEETPAEVIAGAVSNVRIVMTRTGAGNITVDFDGQDDACGGISCDDNNPCTIDQCDPATGTCRHAASPTCCVSDTDCNDGNACTADRCDAATGNCTHSPLPTCCTSDADCNDGNVCTGDRCDTATGKCTQSPLPTCCASDADCNDGNVCTGDRCDTATGKCTHSPLPTCCTSDSQCDDGLFCNGQERCNAGSCIAGSPVVCPPSDSCTTSMCSESARACVSQPAIKTVTWEAGANGQGTVSMRCAERRQVFSSPLGVNGFCELNTTGQVRAQLELAGTSTAGPFALPCSTAADSSGLFRLTCCVN